MLGWKAYVTSIFKLTWSFGDYPLDYVDQGEPSSNLPARLQHFRWRADIVNWSAMYGAGETREQALADLKQKFEAHKDSGKKMWRPGTGPGITFASNVAVSRYPGLRDDFIRRVLELDWAWISDDSSLWDFHENETNDKYYARIIEVYGVDVSDIEDANLASILERIDTR